MEVTIGKHFEFEASHKLPDEAVYGKCSKLHGHRYELDIEIEGRIKPAGWVCDFGELKDMVNEHVIKKYDHSNLNDFFDIPTVENIAVQIFNALDVLLKDKDYKLNKVKIYETRTSYAEITRKQLV
jgi:6-pyruvoyltetrahydropterin/6-carboxytetrahydropterin synthase